MEPAGCHEGLGPTASRVGSFTPQLVEAVQIGRDQFVQWFLELEPGEHLCFTVVASAPVDVMIYSEEQYERWADYSCTALNAQPALAASEGRTEAVLCLSSSAGARIQLVVRNFETEVAEVVVSVRCDGLWGKMRTRSQGEC